MKKNKLFTVEYTNYAKGLAIILLLIHHFLFVPFSIPFCSGSIRELIVLLSKVCVSLFSFLSGYGIAKSYEKTLHKTSGCLFAIKHIKKLLINYWWIYIPVLLLSLTFGFIGYPAEVYGTGVKGFAYFVLDFTGLRALIYSPTYCNTWWFIEATLVFYAAFPLIHKFCKKKPLLLFVVLLVPIIIANFDVIPPPFNKIDKGVYYLFSFALGVLFSDKQLLDKAIQFCHNNKVKYSLFVMGSIVIGICLAATVKLFGMSVFAVSLILLVILLKSKETFLSRIFEFFGKYSMNVFLIHSLFMSSVKSQLYIDSIPVYFNVVLQFVLILFSNFVLSFLIEVIKKELSLFTKNRY